MKRLVNRNNKYIPALLRSQWRRYFWDAVFPQEIRYNLSLQQVFVDYCIENDVVIHHNDCDEMNNSPDNLYLLYRPEHNSITPMYLYEEYRDYADSLLESTDKSGYYLNKYLCENPNDELSGSLLNAILYNFTVWQLPSQEDPIGTPMFQKALNDYSKNFVYWFLRYKPKSSCRFVGVESYELSGHELVATLIFDTKYGEIGISAKFVQRNSTFWKISEFSKPKVDAYNTLKNLFGVEYL